MSLTPKQQRFVEEYLVDLNATQAAIRAGYSAKTAEAAASRLLRNVKVAEAVSAARAAVSERTGVTVDAVIEEMRRIAFADPRQVMEWGPFGVRLRESEELSNEQAAIVAEIAQTKEGMRVKLHSKLDALTKLGQHLGMFTERVELTGADGSPIEQVHTIRRIVVDPGQG